MALWKIMVAPKIDIVGVPLAQCTYMFRTPYSQVKECVPFGTLGRLYNAKKRTSD